MGRIWWASRVLWGAAWVAAFLLCGIVFQAIRGSWKSVLPLGIATVVVVVIGAIAQHFGERWQDVLSNPAEAD